MIENFKPVGQSPSKQKNQAVTDATRNQAIADGPRQLNGGANTMQPKALNDAARMEALPPPPPPPPELLAALENGPPPGSNNGQLALADNQPQRQGRRGNVNPGDVLALPGSLNH